MGWHPVQNVPLYCWWVIRDASEEGRSGFLMSVMWSWAFKGQVLGTFWLRPSPWYGCITNPCSSQATLRKTVDGNQSECWTIFTKLYDQQRKHQRFPSWWHQALGSQFTCTPQRQSHSMPGCLQVRRSRSVPFVTNAPFVANQANSDNWWGTQH